MDHVKKQPKKYCFARNHMTMRQYGLYSTVRELQSKWDFIYFDGDDLSKSFTKTSRDVIYDDCKVLVTAGWFEEKGKRNRKKDGTYEARKLVAITHKEWSAKYPNHCNLEAQPVAPQQLDKAPIHSAISDSPVGNQRLTSRLLAIDQSLPTNKDLVQDRQGSKTNMVQGRPETENSEICLSLSDSTPDTTPQERKRAREAEREEPSWTQFDSIQEVNEFYATTANDPRWETHEHVLLILPDGYKGRFEKMRISYRKNRLVGRIPKSQRGKTVLTGSPGVYRCQYGDCDNLAEDLSLYCADHSQGHGVAASQFGKSDERGSN